MIAIEEGFFEVVSNQKIFYKFYKGDINIPAVVYLHGYMSDLQGDKAKIIESLCIKSGAGFLALEYRGHGRSDGDISQITFADWLLDIEKLVKLKLEKRKLVIIGSSFGAWLAFHFALKAKNQEVEDLIVIAPAIDFTNELDKLLSTGKANKKTETRNSIIYTEKSGYSVEFGKRFIENANYYMLMDSHSININCKVLILHGMQDNEVDFRKSLTLSDKLQTNDVKILFFKDEGHRLAGVNGMNGLAQAVDEVLSKYISGKAEY